jgi:hypothetical protein
VRLLLTVADVFTIPNRGIVLTPELVPVGREVFNVGDSLRLRRPDGSDDIVQIGALKFAKVRNARSQLGNSEEFRGIPGNSGNSGTLTAIPRLRPY